MKHIRHTILALVIALPTLASACGYYGRFDFDPPLTSKTVKAQGFMQMTSETFQFYADPDGKEVRHGITTQFDIEGNKIAEARYQHGKVMDGTVASIRLSCGISANRKAYAQGKEIRYEQLSGTLAGSFESDTLGFVVDAKQHLPTGSVKSGKKQG